MDKPTIITEHYNSLTFAVCTLGNHKTKLRYQEHIETENGNYFEHLCTYCGKRYKLDQEYPINFPNKLDNSSVNFDTFFQQMINHLKQESNYTDVPMVNILKYVIIYQFSSFSYLYGLIHELYEIMTILIEEKRNHETFNLEELHKMIINQLIQIEKEYKNHSEIKKIESTILNTD